MYALYMCLVCMPKPSLNLYLHPNLSAHTDAGDCRAELNANLAELNANLAELNAKLSLFETL